MDIAIILKNIISLISALMVLIGSNVTPDVDGGNNNNSNEYFEDTKIIQTEYNEGEFKMGKYDLIVSPDGDDLNNGSLEMPLKTLNGAKERLKLLKGKTQETVTVWFRGGIYPLAEEIEFTETVKSIGNNYFSIDFIYTALSLYFDINYTSQKRVR